MTTLNQVTPVTISSLTDATALTGNEALPIVQAGATVQTPVASLPQGFTAGVITYGDSGGSPFPNYRTLSGGSGVSLTDGGAQGDLTISLTGINANQIADGSVSNTEFQYLDGLASNIQAQIDAKGTGTVTSVSGTSNRITVATGTTTPVIDISSSYAGQATIATVGTVTLGTWHATPVEVTYGGTGGATASAARTNLGVAIGSDVQAFDSDLAALANNSTNGMWTRTGSGTGSARTITGTAGTITVTNGDGVSGNPTLTVDAAYVGQTSITTLGTIATGTWSATAIAVNKGGTGQTTYTDGQLLIGNSSGNTLTKATLTGTSNQVTVTNGNGTITLATPQSIGTASTPQFAKLGLGQAADSGAVMAATGQYFSAKAVCTTTLDWNNGNVQYIVLTNGSQTFTFANPKDGGRYLMIIKQPASGAAGTITWPATVLWPGGVAPTLTATNGKVDVITFVYDGTNTKYYGGSSLNY